MANKFKAVSLDTMIGKHIGKRGTKRRDAFESVLKIDFENAVCRLFCREKSFG